QEAAAARPPTRGHSHPPPAELSPPLAPFEAPVGANAAAIVPRRRVGPLNVRHFRAGTYGVFARSVAFSRHSSAQTLGGYRSHGRAVSERQIEHPWRGDDPVEHVRWSEDRPL